MCFSASFCSFQQIKTFYFKIPVNFAPVLQQLINLTYQRNRLKFANSGIYNYVTFYVTNPTLIDVALCSGVWGERRESLTQQQTVHSPWDVTTSQLADGRHVRQRNVHVLLAVRIVEKSLVVSCRVVSLSTVPCRVVMFVSNSVKVTFVDPLRQKTRKF